MTRSSRQLAFIGAFIFILFCIPLASAQTPEARQLRTKPSEAAPGETIRVEGEGCAPDSDVSITLDAPGADREGKVRSAFQGGFAANLKIPDSTKAGRVWIRATCRSTSDEVRLLETRVLVTRPPLQITLVNVAFGLGTALVVMGFGISLRGGSTGHRPM